MNYRTTESTKTGRGHQGRHGPGYRSTALSVELSSPQGLEESFIQFKCTRYSCDNFTLIHERMCSVSILFQNHPQRYTWTETFHDNLTLPKSIEKCWLERDLNDNLIQQRTGISKVRVQIPLESTFFAWLRRCQISAESFRSCISLNMILK